MHQDSLGIALANLTRHRIAYPLAGDNVDLNVATSLQLLIRATAWYAEETAADATSSDRKWCLPMLHRAAALQAFIVNFWAHGGAVQQLDALKFPSRWKDGSALLFGQINYHVDSLLHWCGTQIRDQIRRLISRKQDYGTRIGTLYSITVSWLKVKKMVDKLAQLEVDYVQKASV